MARLSPLGSAAPKDTRLGVLQDDPALATAPVRKEPEAGRTGYPNSARAPIV